jgi:hypothetical protein
MREMGEGYTPATVATVATFQRPQRQRSRESQLSQGAGLKTEIVTKPKVATVATVAAPYPENQNYGYGVLLLHKGSGVWYLVASCLCTTLHGETAWREASPHVYLLPPLLRYGDCSPLP